MNCQFSVWKTGAKVTFSSLDPNSDPSRFRSARNKSPAERWTIPCFSTIYEQAVPKITLNIPIINPPFTRSLWLLPLPAPGPPKTKTTFGRELILNILMWLKLNKRFILKSIYFSPLQAYLSSLHLTRCNFRYNRRNKKKSTTAVNHFYDILMTQIIFLFGTRNALTKIELESISKFNYRMEEQ